MAKSSLEKALGREINRIAEQVIKRYKPEKIILFGSAARGEFSEDSDVDMLIIKKTRKKRLIDRVGEVLKLCDYNVPFEPLIYTPQELKKMRKYNNPFLEEIMSQGKVIYERK